MKVTWLSGASLLFEGERARILVDPVSVDAEADVIFPFRRQRKLCSNVQRHWDLT